MFADGGVLGRMGPQLQAREACGPSAVTQSVDVAGDARQVGSNGVGLFLGHGAEGIGYR